MYRLLSILIMMIIPVVSFSFETQKEEVLTTPSRDQSFYLCFSEDDTGICDDDQSGNDGTNDIAANVDGYQLLTYYPSADGAFTCTIYVGDKKDLISGSNDLSGDGYSIATITNASGPYIYENANFSLTWVSCATAGQNITVFLEARRIR
ncbi:MAG: hypothetical protein V3V47_03330 [Desulfobacteria bacterium]